MRPIPTIISLLALHVATLLPPGLAAQDASATAASPEDPVPTALDCDPALLLGAEPVPLAAFHAWLVEEQGGRYLHEFARHTLLEQAIPKLSAGEVTTAELALLTSEHSGDKPAWLARLAQLRERAREQAAVRSRREVTEADIRAEWERVYGPNGRLPELRRLWIRIHAVPFPPGATQRDRVMLRETVIKSVKRRVGEFRRRVLAGEDYGQLIAEHSQDETTRMLEGYFPETFRAADWPEEVVRELAKLEPGEYSQPLVSHGGVNLFYVDSVVVTPLEGVRDELARAVWEAPPTVAERAALDTALLAGVDVALLPADPGAGEGCVLIGDQRLPLARYGAFLATHPDGSGLPAYARELVLRELCLAAGSAPTAAEIDVRLTEQIDAEVRTAHTGSRAMWEQALERRGESEALYRRRQRCSARQRLMAEKLLLARRTVSEEDVRALWRERYGEEGRRTDVAFLMRSIPPPAEGTVHNEEDLAQYFREQREQLSTLMSAIRSRITRGEEFAKIVKRYSQDPETKATGGLRERGFQPDLWPEEARAAVAQLAPGATSGVVALPGDRYYLFQRAAEKHVPFESVANDLRAELASRRPGAEDVRAFIQAELARRGVIYYPDLQLPAPAPPDEAPK